MFCSKCGKEVLGQAAFCSHCGNTLSSHVEDKQKSRVSNLMLALAGVAAALSIGFAVLGYYNNKASKQTGKANVVSPVQESFAVTPKDETETSAITSYAPQRTETQSARETTNSSAKSSHRDNRSIEQIIADSERRPQPNFKTIDEILKDYDKLPPATKRKADEISKMRDEILKNHPELKWHHLTDGEIAEVYKRDQEQLGGNSKAQNQHKPAFATFVSHDGGNYIGDYKLSLNGRVLTFKYDTGTRYDNSMNAPQAYQQGAEWHIVYSQEYLNGEGPFLRLERVGFTGRKSK